MNSRQRKTLAAIFVEPTRADIEWSAVESLFAALAAHIEEGNGSRVCVALNGVRAVGIAHTRSESRIAAP